MNIRRSIVLPGGSGVASAVRAESSTTAARDRVRLVCFDLGGVLVRICRSLDEACRAASLTARHDAASLSAHERAWAEVGALYQTGRLTTRQFVERISAAGGNVYSPDEVHGMYHAWLRGEYDGVADVVRRVRRAGIITAALSNTSPGHWRALVDYPAVAELDHRLASHELGLHKPDPAIYAACEQAVGFRGEAVLFFDDTPENVEAARDHGWRGEHIDPHGCPATQMIEHLRRHGII